MNEEPVSLSGPKSTEQHKTYNKVHSLGIANTIEVKSQIFENQGKVLSI